MRRLLATVLTTAVASTTVLAVTQVPAAAAGFTVTTTDDTNDGSCDAGHCSLREAVIAANASAGADFIQVEAGTYTLTRTGNDDSAANGDLDITGPLSIYRVGAGTVIIQAGTDATNGIDKVFSINPLGSLAGFAVSMTNITIRHGRNTQSFASFNGFGGCMDFDAGLTTGGGSLSLTNVVITGCSTADADGGGLAVFMERGGTITIDDSTISNNTANRTIGAYGGGLFIGCSGDTATIDITDTTVSGNTASGVTASGGGIYAFGPCATATPDFSMQHVTISNNTATGSGGGLSTSAPWTIGATGGASVFSGNSAGTGGGIYTSTSATTLTISGAVITGNSATDGSGGGIRGAAGATGDSITGSIITGNSSTAGADGIQVSSGSLSAENNWWGCSGGPGTTGCDTISGGVDADPWLQVRTTVSNSTPAAGQLFTAEASVNTNSAGTDVTSLAAILRGRAISWSLTGVGSSSLLGVVGPDGTTPASLTAASGTGPGTVTANVDGDTDGGTNTANFTRVKATTTTSIISANPSPSDEGQAVTVTYSVNDSSALIPTGNVIVTDGVDSCTATVAAGQCDITLTTPGARTIQAQYAGDASFGGSSSSGFFHTVNSAGPKPIYLVTNAPGGVLNAGDAAIKARLDATGHPVVVVDDDAVGTTDMTDGALIALSSGVVFTKVGNSLADVPVPMITWEGYLFDDNLLGTLGSETPTAYNRIKITNPGHPLAAGRTGSPIVTTKANALSYATVAPSATVVATVPLAPTRAVIFAYDAGDLRTNATPAPACRVGLFPNYFGTTRLNANGRALIDAAITWALACTSPT